MNFFSTPHVIVPIALFLLIYGTSTYANQRTTFVPVSVDQSSGAAK